MTSDFADDGVRDPERHQDRGSGVSQVVNADIPDVGALCQGTKLLAEVPAVGSLRFRTARCWA
jgi:hypothetical protein